MQDWFQDHQTVIYWVGASSLVTMLLFPIIITLVIVRIPEDYFATPRRPHRRIATRRLTTLRVLMLILKNTLGGIFLIAGIAMLVLPGQGILTILLGLSLMNFPGKFRLERWLVTRGATLRLINRLRRRYNRPPLVLNR